jgi:PAS domain S-box-containing protein
MPKPGIAERHSAPGPQRKARTAARQASAAPDFLAGDGEMAELIRQTDWSGTPLGPLDKWPQSLRSAISICLGSRFPIVIYWGAEFVVLYNDAYAQILGSKHPQALGKRCREVWAEIWDVIGPMLQGVVATSEATWSDNQLLVLQRHGYPEECYFSFSFSPVRSEDDTVGGVFTAVIEHTQRVVGERRVAALRDLGAKGTEAKTAEEACANAAGTLSTHGKDIPFALLYLIDNDGKLARLVGAAGVAENDRINSTVVELGAEMADQIWPIGEVMRTGVMHVVENLAPFDSLPPGPWPDPPRQAVLLPIRSNISHQYAGFLVAGVSARLKLDDLYRSFYELVASQISTAVANARAYEAERKRAEALAEIDQAKTAFFSNISHEFRTPLTLMLGPLEDVLAGANLPPVEREQLDVAHRSSLRLLRLVNSLLDFSRIEAGRAQASYEPVDLAPLTAELASNFRSVCERAGLKLVVDCPPLAGPVHIDREMWEKIVLNLLSNAFKFTFEGEIAIRLRAVNGQAELTVRDTGVGIPEHELPRLFERFHRIEGQKSRSYEGSGIGLALVQELVKLHGGAIRADSAANRGASFVVNIPFGTAHLPQDRTGAVRSLASTSVRTNAYVEEAGRWLPDEMALANEAPNEIAEPDDLPQLRKRVRILLADDNADMRAYVRRLLGSNFEVQAVADGEAALQVLREHRSDLVLTDVMMPRLDGFGLLRAIRADPSLRSLPVIMLSARAGEESRVKGLEAGADDYLIKPFSARELIARIGGNLELARMRQEADEALREEARTLDVLNRVGTAIAAELDLERSVQVVTDAATELTGAAFGSFFYNVTDERGESYMLYSLTGAPREAFAKFPLPRNTAVFGPTFRGEGLVRSDDILKDPRYGKNEPHHGMPTGHLPVRSYLSAPVISRSGEVLGGLFFGHPKPGVFTERSERLLKGIAAQAATAIDNGRLYQAAQVEIAERKRAEHALRESEDRLSQVNAELGRRLTELQTVHKDVQESRRAALNLMEDAVQSRQAVEALNVELRDRERRFREMIDAIPAVVYTTDAEGHITHFNPAAVEFSGRTPELGTDRWCVSWKLYHPDGTPMPHDECPMAIALKEGRVVRGAEALIERPDGTRRWFAPYPTPLRDAEGRIVGGINMLVDITERKAAEETRARIASIVESSDDAIISKSLDGIVATWNRGAQHLFGYTSEEAIGRPITMLIPPDRLQEEPEILARLKRGEHVDHFETVRVRKDGSPLEVSLTISPIRDERGAVIGASKIARDITETKSAQRRQRVLTDELVHRGKNLLGVVQAMVSLSLSGGASLADVRETLTKRIQALSRSQSVLVNGGLEGARLAEIIRLEAEAFSDKVDVSGPDLMLKPRLAQTFALLVHELATNATKHGALSRPQGRVAIDWSVAGTGAEARFKFRWQESGGPPVTAPTRQGFGRTLIEKAVAQELEARPKMEFAPEGLRYQIDAPLAAILRSDA